MVRILAIAKLNIGRQSGIIEDVGDRKGSSWRSNATWRSEGRSSSSGDSNNRERGLAELGKILRIHAVLEMEDTTIKENGGNSMLFGIDNGTVQGSNELVQRLKKKALTTGGPGVERHSIDNGSDEGRVDSISSNRGDGVKLLA